MINRLAGAIVRSLFVAFVIALPALAIPGLPADVSQIAALTALVAGGLICIEYTAVYPSMIEFRSAPPYNRIRISALFLMLVLLTAIVRNAAFPSLAGRGVTELGTIVGSAMDFPFSPVRLVLLSLPPDASAASLALTQSAAGIAHVSSLTLVIVFVVVVRFINWPVRRNAFNVLVNLPLFDPTAGGDVLRRLNREGQVNVALGFLLPFLIPAVLRAVTAYGSAMPFEQPLTLVWVMTLWGFLPACMIMRGVALMRIAELIEEKRRRAYAQSEHFQPV